MSNMHRNSNHLWPKWIVSPCFAYFMDASNPCHVQIHVQQLDSFDAEGQGAPEFHGHKWWRKRIFHSSDMLRGVSEIFSAFFFLKKWELVLDLWMYQPHPAPNFFVKWGIDSRNFLYDRQICLLRGRQLHGYGEGGRGRNVILDCDPCLGYTIYTPEN